MNDTEDPAGREAGEAGRSGGRSAAAIALRLNARLESLMPFLTPAGVVIGFLFPAVFVQLRPYIPWLFGAITLSSALKLHVRDLGAAAMSPVPVIGFFAAAHILMPLLAFAAARLALPSDHDAAAGFVLLYSSPTAVVSVIWISIFHGDAALALALVLLDTLLAPFVVPFTTSLFLGTSVAMDGAGMAVSLAYMVVVPTVLGVALNEASRGAIPRAAVPFLTPVSKILLALVIAANSAAVAPTVDFADARVWAVGLVSIGLTALGFVLGRALGFLPGINDARRRGLVFSVGLRNITAAATLAIAFFPEAAALPAVLGMFLQQTFAALSGRLLLGKPAKEG